MILQSHCTVLNQQGKCPQHCSASHCHCEVKRHLSSCFVTYHMQLLSFQPPVQWFISRELLIVLFSSRSVSFVSHLCCVRINDLLAVFTLKWYSCWTFNINPFTAMLAPPPLGKWPTKVPNLKSLRSFFPFAWTREKISIKMHTIESRFVTGPSKYAIYRRVCVHFSAQKFYRRGQWRG